MHCVELESPGDSAQREGFCLSLEAGKGFAWLVRLFKEERSGCEAKLPMEMASFLDAFPRFAQ